MYWFKSFDELSVLPIPLIRELRGTWKWDSWQPEQTTNAQFALVEHIQGNGLLTELKLDSSSISSAHVIFTTSSQLWKISSGASVVSVIVLNKSVGNLEHNVGDIFYRLLATYQVPVYRDQSSWKLGFSNLVWKFGSCWDRGWFSSSFDFHGKFMRLARSPISWYDRPHKTVLHKSKVTWYMVLL